jgi:hypothetical protein
MAVRLSDLVRDEAFGVRNRRDLKGLYDAVKRAVKDGQVQLEGHSLPVSFNEWLDIVGDKGKPLTRDVDMVDFSLAQNDAFTAWRETFMKAKHPERHKPVFMSEASKFFLERVKHLDDVRAESMLRGNMKKEDVVSILSDLQGAVSEFLSAYDEASETMRLPRRDLPLEQVRIRRKKV